MIVVFVLFVIVMFDVVCALLCLFTFVCFVLILFICFVPSCVELVALVFVCACLFLFVLFLICYARLFFGLFCCGFVVVVVDCGVVVSIRCSNELVVQFVVRVYFMCCVRLVVLFASWCVVVCLFVVCIWFAVFVRDLLRLIMFVCLGVVVVACYLLLA